MIDVIVPVFRGLDATQRCLASVLAHPQRAASDVVVIDDASPEPEIATWLDELAAQQRIELLRNEATWALCIRSTAGSRCIPIATWCSSTATLKLRTTGSTACRPAPAARRTSAR